MASVNELKDVLKETLEEKGVLTKIRAKIRAEIFNTLNDQGTEKAPVSSENMIINELIREYMEFNNYNHALSVFIPETGQPQQPPFDRNFIAKKLKIIEDKNTRDLPLLYGIVYGVKKMVTKDLVQESQNNTVSQKLGKTQFADDLNDNDTSNFQGQQSKGGDNKPLYQNIFN
ncbi:fop amine-terminal dimerization domain protein (macronuclear) [Tetrahymena thermophila SB210]|uniref:Centrosomal protein 20 n=1 Tax=Tetrahymena thermophila (strain SB210) TaxID=312017 RepID=I7MCW0_TETTS|nr:fop amine-terminal dimerization domain protein [Tetrahymena thermophila SB210]EAR85025.1 fop amine-terminal dimerization domain protein [Tetrahymena thermophila SB210]|eukprot:XP_001032688.1 fop amine-terminal dimerization domain protein [Tetrahymena thermophila SB210]